MAEFCKCGCGENTKPGNVFVHGHNSRFTHPMQGRKHSEETRKKLSDSHQGPRPWRLGFTHTEETRKQLSASHKGVTLSIRHRESIGKSSKRVWAAKNPEEREKWIKNIMGPHGCSRMKGHRHTEGANKRNSEKHKQWWANPDNARKCLVFNSPNKQETKLEGILESMYPGEWKFVGNGQVVIAGKCPDFINVNGQKKIIELYGERWHKNHDPQRRADVFSPFGYETLVIWVKELNSIKRLKPIIESFCGGV